MFFETRPVYAECHASIIRITHPLLDKSRVFYDVGLKRTCLGANKNTIRGVLPDYFSEHQIPRVLSRDDLSGRLVTSRSNDQS